MDNTIRLQYLKAMGIDVWQPRTHIHGQSTSVNLVEMDDNWDSLEADIAQCTRCNLCETRKLSVFGSGNKNADWMIIDDTPRQSDNLATTLLSASDLLLTEMLRAIGLDRQEVFITNTIKCSPRGNHEPKPSEIEGCKMYLLRQQALIKPIIILALGVVAAKSLLGTDKPIEALREKSHTLNDTPIVVSYEPAVLLTSSLDKRKAWSDLKFAIQIIKNK
ncbi:MAG: uracil-DNA glycosylase, partial [Methylobacter sp.]|nr:uracil-DNA glycosylase [Methylobacter sp.]